jgi:hypothetical protein
MSICENVVLLVLGHCVLGGIVFLQLGSVSMLLYVVIVGVGIIHICQNMVGETFVDYSKSSWIIESVA